MQVKRYIIERKPTPGRIIREKTKVQPVQKVQIVYRTISELKINIQLFYTRKDIKKVIISSCGFI